MMALKIQTQQEFLVVQSFHICLLLFTCQLFSCHCNKPCGIFDGPQIWRHVWHAADTDSFSVSPSKYLSKEERFLMFGGYLKKHMKLIFRSKSKEEKESLHKGKMENPWLYWLFDISRTKWANRAQSPFMTSESHIQISRVTCDLLSLSSSCRAMVLRGRCSDEHPSSALNLLWDTQKTHLRISVSHKSLRPGQRAEGSMKGVVFEPTVNSKNLSFYLVIFWTSITDKWLWMCTCTT